MRSLIYIPLATLLLSGVSGCASKTPRTKWTDPEMRVMIDPYSVSADSYVDIQRALMETGKWIVVDRANAFKAAKLEQDRLHRSEADRFADREKYAHWGKLYGVGGIVTAHKQCTRAWGWFGGRTQNCSLHLAIISANTAEVLSAVSLKAEVEGWDVEPDWSEAAIEMTERFPKHFKPNRNHERLERYKDISAEEAIRQKELLDEN